MRPLIPALAFLMLASSATAQTAGRAPPTAIDSELPTYDEVGLEWKRAPSVIDLVRRYPMRAQKMEVRRGLAQMDCTAKADGRLTCAVLNESPQEMGFGAAGLRVMQPVTVKAIDGTSPEGKRFGFNLKFGRWPASAAPTAKQLRPHGLTWAKLPGLSKGWWGEHGRAYEVELECETREDGSLDCGVLNASDPGFGRHAQEEMKVGRVRALDGKPLAGRRFKYVYSQTRS